MSKEELTQKLDAFLILYGNSLLTTQPIQGPGYVEPPVHMASRVNTYGPKILDLIDQYAYEYAERVIGSSSIATVMSPGIMINSSGHIDNSWTDEHEKYKVAHIEDALRFKQRKTNQDLSPHRATKEGGDDE